ncbi:MAG: ethanolamine ammonia-lyase reactivating factor EutA [Lachnospiraceae bacterium]|nr:ethanolamine ammonia-lyase reactivating factor EutA [Lachnospiraceae bacterium]MDD3617499.1 ethanolamine ammonia-lyase reactivating factor EutA [Lachnospiraceae bacterium]
MGDIYSIGVDIGTSTTNVILSQIQLSTSMSASLLPVTSIGDTKVIYKSPVIFTPIKEHQQIDFLPIRDLVEDGLSSCGIQKEQIETGAVIITGETARKDNAAGVGRELSEYLGDFVVACAGPQLESVLAGHGAGAQRLSKEKNKRVLNLDIGGGTLNAAVFYCGDLESAFAMDIGGRLIRINQEEKITYISDRIAFIIEENQLSLKLGEEIEWKALRTLCRHLAEDCVQVSGLADVSAEAERLFISPYEYPKKIDLLTVSGGVGECVQRKFKEDTLIEHCMEYLDMGPMLAHEIQMELEKYPQLYTDASEGIRATVIGAGNHSMTVSGSTVGVESEILPMRNIPIIKSRLLPENWKDLYREIMPILQIYGDNAAAISIKGETSPAYGDLKILAQEIGKIFRETEQPVILLMQEDFAKALSQMIHIYGNVIQPVICLDGIDTEHGDYIDIGKPMGSAVPVVVKTLVYQS